MADAIYNPAYKTSGAMQAGMYWARKRNRSTALVDDLASLAWGSISFSSQPANASTITLGGTVVTFGTDVTIGGTLAATLANLLTFLNASANANIIKSTYAIEGTTLAVKYKTPGVATFTLAASGTSNGTVSAATLKLVKIYKRPTL